MALRIPFAAIATAATVVLLMLVSGSPAWARIEISKQDRQFLKHAHQDNLAGIAAGKAAEDKGKAEVVRSIGATIAADHAKLDTSVKETARRLGVSLPSEPSAEQKAGLEKLTALSGSAFDRAWLAALIEDHRTALEKIKQEIQNGSSTDVKAVAESSKPVVQGHLDRLLEAQKTLGALRRN
ncbi:DUF4142 domain-containing protein [Sphaerisporangium sp. NBC_01403]|uniref:DUF4142 domain-containing protein n=1 Tax=Sphaerisporangium sp. NBC_01403 TaxID=2903599 RepID=UPI003253D9CE